MNDMPRIRTTLRLLAWVIAGLGVAVLIPAGVIRVDQYLLRWKAEHLLTDLKSLEMRKSTYRDAGKVIDRWKGSIRQERSCQPSRCDVEIGITDFPYHHLEFFTRHQKLLQAWRLLGGRPSQIDGCIRVRRDVVWGKGIRAIVLAYSAGYKQDVNLIGRMGSGSPGSISPLHPEYDVGVGHHTTGSLTVGAYADFTPYADPADVNRLMDIDFSCLTRWHSCQTGADIAPVAWHEAAEEAEAGLAGKFSERTCGRDVIRVLARESRRAVVGEVNRVSLYAGLYDEPNSASQDPSNFVQVKILFKDDLKHCNLSSLSALQNYSFNEPLPAKEKVGDRFILFFKYKDKLYSDNYRTCDLLPATNENIEAVRNWAAEDWADHNDEF